MKIKKIAYNATDIEKLYDHLKKSLDHLNRNYIGKSKLEIKRAIKKLEQIRPHLKYKDRPLRGVWWMK